MKPYEVITVTRDSSLSAAERLVLIHVAFRAGEDGSCWAAATTLASDTGLSERQVRRILAALVAANVLEVEARPGRTAVYFLGRPFGVPRSTPDTMSEVNPGHHVTPDTMSGVPRTWCPDTPDTMSDDPIHDPIQGLDPRTDVARATRTLEDEPTEVDRPIDPVANVHGVKASTDPLSVVELAELARLEVDANPERLVDPSRIHRVLLARCRAEGWTVGELRALWLEALGWMTRSPPTWSAIFGAGWAPRREALLERLRHPRPPERAPPPARNGARHHRMNPFNLPPDPGNGSEEPGLWDDLK